MVAGERDALLSEREQHGEAGVYAAGRNTASKEAFEDPREWPMPFKWMIVSLLAFLAFNVTFTCIAIVPLADHVVTDLGNGSFSKSASVLLVTIWELGEAAGPLLFAPLSEMFGRRVILNSANILFVLAATLGALSQSTELFIATRALGGLAVASNVLNACIISDIFIPEERGSALSIAMTAPLVGSAIGPVAGGIVGDRFGWRSIMWICVALSGVCELALLTCFKETYRPSLQQTKTREDRDSKRESLWVSAARPAYILGSSKVLVILCVFNAIIFAIYYIMAVTLADILENIYDKSPTVAGTSFLIFTAGLAIGLITSKLTMDRYYKHLSKRNSGVGQPEFWLPLTIAGSAGVPPTLILYGWAAQMRLPLPIFLLSLVLMGTTVCLAFIPTFAYVIEAFGLYSASAMAGVIVTRCLTGVFLPLLMVPLIREFGYGWAFTLVGAASACVAPIPMLVMWYGGRWRQSSKYTRVE